MRLSDDTYLISGNQQKISTDVGKFLSSMRARLDRLGASWAASRARAQQMRDLHRFNDRELWDLGLSRSDIGSIERGTYRRE
jgi:uncharacterized protein YjiS (DUF1127 family)